MKFLFKFRVLEITILFSLVACSSAPPRTPSSSASGPQASLSGFTSGLKNFTNGLQDPNYKPQNCEADFREVEKRLSSLDWSDYSFDEIRKESPALLKQSWALRLQLHQHLAVLSPACKLQVREIFHQQNDIEDYASEFAYNEKALNPADMDFQRQAIPIYDHKYYPPYSVRGDVDQPQFQFKSGDLMLARGVSFFSAIISQLTDNKSQFSHVVFLNEDEKTKALNTVESYIGSGVSTYDIEYALKNENARLLVLRPKDPELGKKAAALAMDAAKRKVSYDYFMNFDEPSKMSCVEVARYSYKKASEGTWLVPEQPANLSLNNKNFLKKLNLSKGPLITPDDLETDSHFELLLDWRDYRLIRDSRHKDAILSEMVRWMDKLGYKFHDTFDSVIAKNIVLPSRPTLLWPLVKLVTGAPADLDPNIPRKTLGVMTVLNQLGQDLLGRLNQLDVDYIAANNRPMTNKQLRAAVNKLREEDLENYKQYSPTFLHYALRPDKIP